MSITTALYCDRCKDTVFTADLMLFQDDAGLHEEAVIVMREAIKVGWLVQNDDFVGITWSEAVCPSCRAAGLGLQWKEPKQS